MNPASNAFLQASIVFPWSKCSATSVSMFKSLINPFTKLLTVLYPPIYLAAPSLTPNITGLFNLLHSSSMYFVHSRLFILKCATAYLFSFALLSMSFMFFNIISPSSLYIFSKNWFFLFPSSVYFSLIIWQLIKGEAIFNSLTFSSSVLNILR